MNSAENPPPSAGARRYAAVREVVGQKIGTETVVVHMGTNRIYELNGTAAHVWDLLREGRTWDAVLEDLLRGYDAPAEALRSEVEAFLEMLLQEGLIVPAEEER